MAPTIYIAQRFDRSTMAHGDGSFHLSCSGEMLSGLVHERLPFGFRGSSVASADASLEHLSVCGDRTNHIQPLDGHHFRGLDMS